MSGGSVGCCGVLPTTSLTLKNFISDRRCLFQSRGNNLVLVQLPPTSAPINSDFLGILAVGEYIEIE